MENNELTTSSTHIAPLDADNIPNENQAHYCFSCEEPMKGAYCIACGQKNDDLRRGIFSLTWELFKSVIAIEGRIWRTWRRFFYMICLTMGLFTAIVSDIGQTVLS